MNSASATFWVQETAYVVRSLTQHMHQATNSNGYITGNPIIGEMRLVLEVQPRDVLLPTWAYNPAMTLPARVVFDALDAGSMSLTLTLEEAYCVSYEEHYESQPGGKESSFYCVVSVVARRIIKHGVEYVNHWPGGTK